MILSASLLLIILPAGNLMKSANESAKYYGKIIGHSTTTAGSQSRHNPAIPGLDYFFVCIRLQAVRKLFALGDLWRARKSRG